MNEHKFSFRLWALAFVVVAIMGIFAVRLHTLQVVEATPRDEAPGTYFTYTTRVVASRGEVLDRNGTTLIGNRAAYNITLHHDVIYSAENPNEEMRRLTELIDKLGLTMVDHFPVTTEKPYEYTTDRYSSAWNDYFMTYLEKKGWDSDISAAKLIRQLRERYHFPDSWTEEEARRVISLRYELDLRYYTNLPLYVMVEDIDAISLAALKELNTPGLNTETTTVREYHTDYAAHILGRVASMSPEEWEVYQEQGYSMDAKVGKDGLEKAFEEQLHGTDGLMETTIATDGTVLSQEWIREPVAGNNVELTVDIDLQKIAEDELERVILDLRENGAGTAKNGKDAEGGAVVVMSAKTGEVLACASYPTYSLLTFSEDYSKILEEPYAPLNNRALDLPYPPGSTFKMVTTIAAVDTGTITPDYTVEDKGVYREFQDIDPSFAPRCMLYTTSKGQYTHGVINVMQALSVSCNYYFYDIGWKTGIEPIDAVAKALGLGEATGVELPEKVGYRANPETKKKLYDSDYNGWYGADTVLAAIGQSENRFTPMQLCSYTCALANDGTRYKATFLKRVLSSDYQELIYSTQPEVLSKLQMSETAINAYKDGMRLAVTSWDGTCHGLFGDYPVAVCAKTGTAEHGSGGSDNAAYVLFAPMDDPQIAIAIYVEKGAQGGNLGNIAKPILNAYFSDAGTVDTVPAENRMG